MDLVKRALMAVPQLRQMQNTRDFYFGEAQRLRDVEIRLEAESRALAQELQTLQAQAQRDKATLAEQDARLSERTAEVHALRVAAMTAPAPGGDAALAQRLAQTDHDLAVLRHTANMFPYYYTSFDAEAVIRRHAAPHVHASPDHYTNFLGVKVPPQIAPSFLEALKGHIEPIPIPANFHADVAEWAPTLRSVDLAKGRYTMIELGCGWGCWMNNMGAAARQAGLQVHVIGVEGDESHVRFAAETLADNGFSPDQYTLLHGIAAPTGGTALFPRVDQPGEVYGSEPIFGATEELQRAAQESGRYDILPMIALSDVAEAHDRIDLLHIDIQGGEGDFIDGCLPVMNEKVGYLFVGTHSRELEGRIFQSMIKAGWVLEIERPAVLALPSSGRPVVHIDGAQGWRNPRLNP